MRSSPGSTPPGWSDTIATSSTCATLFAGCTTRTRLRSRREPNRRVGSDDSSSGSPDHWMWPTIGHELRCSNARATFLESVPSDHPDLAFPGPVARELVQWLDAHALHPTRISRYFAISPTVARRPGYFPAGVAVDVAIPPSSLSGLHSGPYRSIFTASRLDAPKRVDLLIDAMQFVTGSCELRIAGSVPQSARCASGRTTIAESCSSANSAMPNSSRSTPTRSSCRLCRRPKISV